MLYLRRQCWRRVVSWAVTEFGFLTLEYALFRAAVLALRRLMGRYSPGVPYCKYALFRVAVLAPRRLMKVWTIAAECAPQPTASLRLEVPVVNRILKLTCFSWYPCQVACYDVLVDVGLQINI